MHILKFGGTSVKDAEAIVRAAEIIQDHPPSQLVVVSACSQITNLLSELIESIQGKRLDRSYVLVSEIYERHEQIICDLKLPEEAEKFLDDTINKLKQRVHALTILEDTSERHQAALLAIGEQLSSKLIYFYLKSLGMSITHMDASKVIKTTGNSLAGDVDFNASNQEIACQLRPLFNFYDTVICGGFISSDAENFTTVLGRGGSDFSAAIFGAALEADAIEIWTDVDGVMTTDPRLVENVRHVSELTYQEAAELAYFGAKVLHPKTIAPAVKHHIPVIVRNSFKPDHLGTKISLRSELQTPIKSLAFRKEITVVHIQSNRMLGAYGFLRKVFEIFDTFHTPVDLVTTSEVSISLTVDNPKYIEKIKSELSMFANVTLSHNKAIIAAIGEGIRNTAGISAKVFNALNGINISMVSIGSSEVNLSLVVDESDLETAVNSLHETLFQEVYA